MKKLVTASALLFFLFVLQSNAFAGLNCKFKNDSLPNIKSLELSEESLLLNNETEIPLSKSRVRCRNAVSPVRLDGSALGYQVVLKSCIVGEMEGHLIDSVEQVAAEITCGQI